MTESSSTKNANIIINDKIIIPSIDYVGNFYLTYQTQIVQINFDGENLCLDEEDYSIIKHVDDTMKKFVTIEKKNHLLEDIQKDTIEDVEDTEDETNDFFRKGTEYYVAVDENIPMEYTPEDIPEDKAYEKLYQLTDDAEDEYFFDIDQPDEYVSFNHEPNFNISIDIRNDESQIASYEIFLYNGTIETQNIVFRTYMNGYNAPYKIMINNCGECIVKYAGDDKQFYYKIIINQQDKLEIIKI